MAKPRVTNNLPQFVGTVQQRGARTMTQVLILGASEASVLTPIDTSFLLNSQYKDVRVEGDKVIGSVGYTADYAKPVHDPEVKQNFRRATAQKEFLRKGFERAKPNIDKVIAGGLKT
jgi:hypothetical protein